MNQVDQTRKSWRKSLGAALAALALCFGPASAEEYPSKPVTLIVPLGAGGSHDLNARVLTTVLPKYLGQPVVVQLMPGASGQTGTAAAAKAKPDGYTLLYSHNFIDQLQQHIVKLPYDPLADFTTVARNNYASLVAIVPAGSPFQTLADVVSYGKEHPGELRFGHTGNWGSTMIAGAMFFSDLGIDTAMVPYKGGGPALQGLLAGDVDFTLAMKSTYSGQQKQVRELAVFGPESGIAGVPSIAEAGYPELADIGTMHRIILAPSGIPDDRLAVLREAFGKLPQDPDYAEMMAKMGENMGHMDGADYEALRREQNDAFGALIGGLQN